MDRNWELTPFLDDAKVMQPAMFAAGEHDLVIEMARAGYDTLESHVPRLTKKVLIPGAGHWIQQERPTEVNRLMIEFLKTL